MPLVTLAEAKTSRLRQVSAACPNSSEFISLVNDATRMLMRRGHWFGTLQKIRGCVYNNCITWPRSVGTVLALNRCAQHVPVWNNWYEFVPLDQCDCDCAFGWRHRNLLVNDGQTPVFNNIECGKEVYIRVYPSNPSDIGKSITIYGIDSNGQMVRSKRDDGTFQDGVVLTIALPYATTQFKFRNVTRVLKEVTDSPIRLYQFDSDNNVLLDMAFYEAGETSPSYRHTVLSASRFRNCLGTCSSGLKQLTALVKLEFVPVVYDDDIVQIENLDALKLAIQAIKASEGYSFEEREKAMLLAIRELNLGLEDKFPIQQAPVNINPFGTARPARAGIGRLI